MDTLRTDFGPNDMSRLFRNRKKTLRNPCFFAREGWPGAGKILLLQHCNQLWRVF